MKDGTVYCKASVREKVNREQELTLFAKYKLKQAFKIQFLFRLISQNYIELTARDHYWLCSLPSASQHPAVTQPMTSAQEKCWGQHAPDNWNKTVSHEGGRPEASHWEKQQQTPLQRLQRKQQYSWGILFQIKWMLKVKNRTERKEGQSRTKEQTLLRHLSRERK